MGKTPFIPRMWVFFRVGHGQYLVYLMALSNFTILIYNFLIKEIEWLQPYIPNFIVFLIIFTPLYLPLAIGIGYGHYKTQLEHDFTEWHKKDKPLLAISKNQENICKKLGIKYVRIEDIEFE